jgi:uncharacterized protein (TIGR00296 family)
LEVQQLRQSVLARKPLETNPSHSRQSTQAIGSKTGLEILTIIKGTTLVKAARHAITSHLSKSEPADFDHAAYFPQGHGVFVSLYDISKGHSLRGCVGDPSASGEFLAVMQRVAVEAAVADYRFKPVNADEFEKSIVVEVNVLSPLEPIWVRNPEDYVLNITVGLDGLIVDGSVYRGLLLPQVAVEEGFDAEEFLSHCCMKAGLPPDSWLTGNVRIFKFQGRIFSEETPKGRVVDKHVESSMQ